MTDLAHFTVVFRPTGGKEISCGVDFLVGGASSNWTSALITEVIDAFYDGFDGSPAVDDTLGADMQFIRAEGFAFTPVTDTDRDPCKGEANRPFKRQNALGPIVTTGAAKAGTVGQLSLPPNVALVCTLRTALSSRRTRGRLYTPAPPENQVDAAGAVTTAHRDLVRTAWQSWITGAENSAPALTVFTHVIWSSCLSSVEPVTAYTVGNRVDTQRRRLQRQTV